jgi:hypothetical protein
MASLEVVGALAALLELQNCCLQQFDAMSCRINAEGGETLHAAAAA